MTLDALSRYNASMWAARVYRKTAHERPAEACFWLRFALEEFKRARVARDRMRGVL